MCESERQLSEVCQLSVEELLTALKSPSKSARRSALDKFHQENLEQAPEGSKPLSLLYRAVSSQVIRCLGDEAEACRASALAVMDTFVKTVDMSDYQLTYIMPALLKRIGQPEIVEESEELRLAFIELVRRIIARSDPRALEPFMNDFMSILCKTIQDPFPDGRVAAATCIEELSLKIPRSFHMQAESFVKPLLPSLSHQRFKVRVAAVKTLGAVVMAGPARCFELAVSPLAEKLFDEVQAVRRQVLREVGRWMLEHRDRYSYWHRMLPIILTGLSDVSDEIREESSETWDRIGLKFMEENEEDLKKMTDFMSNDIPYGYPNVTRPNLGCRTLVTRNIGKILPAIARECVGWQADARYRVVQLLRWLLLCAETGATQNCMVAANILLMAARDDDPRVVREMELSAEYYGVFIEPECWWPLLRPSMHSWSAPLVMAHVALGAGDKLLRNGAAVLREIASEIADPDYCETRKENHQNALLTFCANVLKALQTESTVIKDELFTVTFTVYAVAEGEVKERALDVLSTLSAACSYEDLSSLYGEHACRTVSAVTSDPLCWSVASPQYCIVYTVLTEFGSALSRCTAELSPLLRRVLTEPKLDAKVKVKLYNALSVMLLDKRVNFSRADHGELLRFYTSILEDIIMAQLVWQPGLTAESVRCAAVSCLCCLMQSEPDADLSEDSAEEVDVLWTDEQLSKVTDEIAALVPSLLDDRSELTRHRALTVAILCANNAHRRAMFTVEHLHKIYFAVVKRLDDSSGAVRTLAARALVELFRRRPESYDRVQYGAHIEAVYSTMLVHLDDPDAAFRDHILKCLQELYDLDPELLMKKVKANLPLYRNKEAFETLQESLAKLAVRV